VFQTDDEHEGANKADKKVKELQFLRSNSFRTAIRFSNTQQING